MRIPLWAALSAAAVAVACAEPVNFYLPTQPAVTVLVAFARQAGVEVLFSYDDDSLQSANRADLLHYNSSYTSGYLWARWQGSLGTHLSGETVLSLSHLTWQADGDGVYGGVNPVTVNDDRRLTLTSMRQDWTYTLTDRALLRGGFEAQSGVAHYD